MRILVVEDHPINRRLLRAQLEGEGLTVLEAVDGAEALARLDQEPVDGVISDILMPRMDGYRLCFELRANPKWRSLPFVFYTATYTTEDDEKVARDFGADGFLRKPASITELMGTLRAALTRDRNGGSAPAAVPEDATLMKVYSERLVAKLEERNLELEAARANLREANASLEARVLERTEELEAVNRQLESFAYFVSHELRSPLRAVEGFVTLIRADYAGLLPDEGQRMFGLVEKNALRMGRLIEDLLRFARLTRASVRRDPVSTRTLVDAAIAELRSDWEKRPVEFQLGELPTVSGDAGLLQIVFLNLINNALKFARPRSPARIDVGSRVVEGRRVWHVRDNGVGFDMAHAEKLFQPFGRLHAADKFEGTGVGLGIVHTIVQRHGGRIWVEAAVDQGAAFYFTLEAEDDGR